MLTASNHIEKRARASACEAVCGMGVRPAPVTACDQSQRPARLNLRRAHSRSFNALRALYTSCARRPPGTAHRRLGSSSRLSRHKFLRDFTGARCLCVPHNLARQSSNVPERHVEHLSSVRLDTEHRIESEGREVGRIIQGRGGPIQELGAARD